jgi:hypothetical protein
MSTEAAVHARNYTHLATEFPIAEIDPHVVFDEAEHLYTVRGTVVPRSATKIIADVLRDEPFDSDLIISKNLASWRRKPRSRYGNLIRDLDDDAARSKLKDLWANANVLGTILHKRFEASLNEAEEPDDGKTDLEWRAVAKELTKLQELGWVPRRTELSMWWERESDGKVVCAGQLDGLFTDADDNLILVDLKRTDHDLSAGVVPYGDKMCGPPMENFYASDYTRYSLQQSIYACMFAQRTGLEVPPDKRFLLQAHPSMPGAVWTQCRCLDAQARELLNALD